MLITMQAIRDMYQPGYGRHWFDPDTMRFFSCRLPEFGYTAEDGSAYFVSSERGPSGVRRYTVRRLTGTGGEIETVGQFQQYATRSAATAAALSLSRIAGANKEIST